MRTKAFAGGFIAAWILTCCAASVPARDLSVEVAVKDLGNGDIRVRWYAAYALGRAGGDAAEAVAPLMKILENQREYEYVRGSVAWALGRIGPKASAAVPLLTQTLVSKHLSVRRAAPLALGEIGDAAKSAVPELEKALDDPDPIVRIHAAISLRKLARSEKSLPLLVKTLEDGKQGAYEAAIALGSLGTAAEPAVGSLATALSQNDPDVRRGAAEALGQIGPAAVPALKKVLTNASPEARRGAVEALARLGKDAVPELVAAIQNDSPVARRAAVRALARLGGDAGAAEEPLVELLKDPVPEVKADAAKALRAIRAAQQPE